MRIALPAPREPHRFTALGADYSSRRLLENLREHASGIDVETFSVGSFEAVHTSLDRTSNFDSQGRRMSLASRVDPSGWDLLHDVRPAGDPRRHFYLRSAHNRCFPIVHTHHALNYPFYLDDYFVPLLLSGSQPYDAVVCQSHASRRAFAGLLELCEEALTRRRGVRRPRFRGQLPVIPNGVDTDLFRPRDIGDVRHQLRLPAGAFVILWIGRLSAATKADLVPLLRAYASLRERNPGREMLLVLVGTDQEAYGRVLEACAAALEIGPSFRIERTTPQTPVHLWYSAADVFVSPVDNVQETFGNTPIEAMASGVPQVVSDWDGYRDTVVHGETGFRIRTFWAKCDEDAVAQWTTWGDSQGSQALLAQAVACDLGELVSYIEYLLRSPEVRYEMAAVSRRRALAEFAWRVIVGRYVDCWTDLVERSWHYTPPTPQPEGIVPAFFRVFAEYASEMLTGESRLRIHAEPRGAAAEKRLETDREPQLVAGGVPNDAALRTVRGLEMVLSALADAGGELDLNALTSTLMGGEYLPTDVQRLVLRGIKYGLIDVCAETKTASLPILEGHRS